MRPAGSTESVVGLAVAWGAGAVVALALAAPASADRSEGPQPGSRTSSAHHSATRGAPSVPRPAAGVQPAAAARSTGAGPARAASARAAEARTFTAAATRTLQLAPPARKPELSTAPAAATLSPPAPAVSIPAAAMPVPPTPARSTPAASAARCVFACDPRGKRVTVYQGLHLVIPASPAFFIKHVSGTGTFTDDSVYDLHDVDQLDWNKVTGIAFSPLQHDRNSAMVGWRYNLTTREFEIAPFYNVDRARIQPSETEVISVPAGQTFDYTVDYSGVTISYGGRTVFKPYPPGLAPNVWTASRVSGWFGGNEAAPRTLSYYLNLT